MKISGIYKITNILNSKIYIGSSINIKLRLKDHKGQLRKNIHHSIHLQRAYNKYGKDKFKFEIIEIVYKNDYETEDEFRFRLTNIIEQSYLDKLEPWKRTNGYNINKIANSQKGRIVSEETKNKISIKTSGMNNPMYGLFGKDHPAFGTKRTEDTLKKMRAKKSGSHNPMFNKLGKDNPTSKKVIQKSLDNTIIKIWDSISDIVRELNFSAGNISSCCNKRKLKTYKKFIWEFI